MTNNGFIAAANSLGVCSDYMFRNARDGECPHNRLSLPPKVLFCFVLFCFVLFCFVLFCFVLFCFLFCFVLFCFV